MTGFCDLVSVIQVIVTMVVTMVVIMAVIVLTVVIPIVIIVIIARGILLVVTIFVSVAVVALFVAGLLTLLTPFGAGVSLSIGLKLGCELLVEERLPVSHRDLVIIRMNFAECEEAMAIAAVFNKRCLQRRLDARYFCQIDVAAQRFASGILIVEFFYTAISQYHHPRFLRVGGIDEHLVGFAVHFLRSCVAREAPLGAASCCPA